MRQLELLDNKLQEFFGSITCQSDVNWGRKCGLLTFIIRYAHTSVLQNPISISLSAGSDLNEFVLNQFDF